IFQWVNLLILGYHYVFGIPAGHLAWALDVPLAFLYGTLIMNVSVIPDRLLNLEWQPLTHLGKISYGIYMYHMAADYLLRLGLSRYTFSPRPVMLMTSLYSIGVLTVTAATAHLSFKYFESYFIGLQPSQQKVRTLELKARQNPTDLRFRARVG